MTANCGTGRYYDSVVRRCQGCHEICYGHQLTDPTSDCNTFCPGFNKPEVPGNVIAPADGLGTVEIGIIVAVFFGLAFLVSAIVVWMKRRRNQLSVPGLPDTTLPDEEEQEEIRLSEHVLPTHEEEYHMGELACGNYPVTTTLMTSEV